tara:strand:+ start:2029 stop:2511 length:483 start_codon:yes stop_codon:yes gene_type:complete
MKKKMREINKMTHELTELENKALLGFIYDTYGVTLDEMKSRNRKRGIIEGKRFYVTALTRVYGLTTDKAGKMCNLDHASVIHHRRKFDSMSETYPKEYIKLMHKYESMINRDVKVHELQDLIIKRDEINNKINKLIILSNNQKLNKNDRKKREELHCIKY